MRNLSVKELLSAVLLSALSMSNSQGAEDEQKAQKISAWGNFTSEDLEKLKANAKPLKQLKVAHIDQKHDVITFFADDSETKEFEAIPPEIQSNKDIFREGEYNFEALTSEDEIVEVPGDTAQSSWTWGQTIPVSPTLTAEVLGKGPYPVMRFGMMEDEAFSSPETKTEFLWGKSLEPSAECLKRYEDLAAIEPERVIAGFPAKNIGNRGCSSIGDSH